MFLADRHSEVLSKTMIEYMENYSYRKSLIKNELRKEYLSRVH